MTLLLFLFKITQKIATIFLLKKTACNIHLTAFIILSAVIFMFIYTENHQKKFFFFVTCSQILFVVCRLDNSLRIRDFQSEFSSLSATSAMLQSIPMTNLRLFICNFLPVPLHSHCQLFNDINLTSTWKMHFFYQV